MFAQLWRSRVATGGTGVCVCAAFNAAKNRTSHTHTFRPAIAIASSASDMPTVRSSLIIFVTSRPDRRTGALCTLTQSDGSVERSHMVRVGGVAAETED